MMLAMMVAALSFTACGGDDEEDEFIDNSSFVVGTWSINTVEGWGLEAEVETEYIQYKSDGTYIDVQLDDGLYISKGTWKISGTDLIMKETEGRLLWTYTFTILNHTKTTLTLEMWGITANATKVPDSTIDKYIK